MIVVGIDPGLTVSHASRVRLQGGSCVYGRQADLAGTFQGDPASLAAQLHAAGPADLILVEVARGAVASARDGDPVLHNNIVAGEILGHLRALGLPAVPVASGGNATAWAWRPSLGVKGNTHGVAAKDALTVSIVALRLTNPEAMPTGPRGGHCQHYWDAAGIALAGLDRLLASPDLPPLEAVNRVSGLEAHKLERRRATKRASKQARAAGLIPGGTNGRHR
ncbi:hypothetical protein Dgeo_3064 (plasmid) [Deinococcus geothermalis DSM 11300]|uniref:Uncharacterized protein n=1 Tax=Deinococcus geothermalis (strain DSM 11300 / CIP 105573 / AG-3a) TaxID=319795 RepID=A8ZRJ6_DEIGD|nr:hypothetical protein [Deinococcus geothermalis]ABW35105.1 hypothetical protein Dgeo_3064 [Deinococcus geothermalis DSM 11300]